MRKQPGIDIQQVQRRYRKNHRGDVRREEQQDDRLREPEGDNPPETDYPQRTVVHDAHIFAAQQTDPATSRPEDVSERAHHALDDIELRLEENPRAKDGNDAGKQCARARADRGGERRG